MLVAENMSVSIHGKPVLNNLSLKVLPGKLTALLGANGAGKSTLLKILAGEFNGFISTRHIKMKGNVSLNGEVLDKISSKKLAKLRAVLPQSSQFIFPFTVNDVVLLGRYPFANNAGILSSNDNDIALAALALVESESLINRDVTTLSGGELARVQLARVLAQLWPEENKEKHAPRYLLLDEPTAALDLAHQHKLLEIVHKLAHDWQIGVLAIVHDPNLAAYYADTFAMLSKGTIFAYGAPSDVMNKENIEHCYGFSVRMLAVEEGKSAFVIPA